MVTIATLRVGVALAKPGLTPQLHRVTAGAITLTTSAAGDPLPRIDCGQGYSATIYASGVISPDGLAFSPDGVLHVAEENGGRVSQIGANGAITPVITGLSNPEGITFDSTGNLYVVEDITGGRVVTRSTTGVTGTLVEGLDAPEGIVWVSDGSPGGILYVTESNLEYAFSISSITPSDYRTHVTAISLLGTKTRILTTTAQVVLNGFTIEATLWSYAGITVGSDGFLYFTNELSGQEITQTVTPFTIHAVSTDSVYTATTAVAPTTPISFADNGLIAPEGLRFSANGGFPLYVAEEDDLGGDMGRLSRVEADGSHSPFCTGFFAIEDVVVDQNGWLYVSEDATGLIILIKPTTTIQNQNVWLPIIIR